MNPDEQPDDRGDFLAEIRALRERIRREHASLDLAVPGTAGRVVVRYEPPPRERLNGIASAIAFGQDPGESVELDLIINACQQILVRPAPNAEPQPIDPDGGPVRFDAGDERLARAFGFGDDVATARDAVRRVFMTDEQPFATAGHFFRLIEWLQGVDAEADARVEGESGGAGG
jgi:hypothetical protein